MVRISRELRKKLDCEIGKAAREALKRELLEQGYITREELAKKYGVHMQKIWRLIKTKGLPYDQNMERIKESEFLLWKELNEHLLENHRGGKPKKKEVTRQQKRK